MSPDRRPGGLGQPGRGTYFFLSYAHSAPTSGGVDTDPWVKEFYGNLYAKVAGLARPDRESDIGFYDGELDLGSNWKVALGRALGAAEVFVPLYSPGYLNRSWPMSERESFRRRLAGSGDLQTISAQAQRHIVPVLWIPVPPWDRTAEIIEALELGDGFPEYPENGLRALCMLSMYKASYETIAHRLARRIVEVAEGSPLGPSRAPALSEVELSPTETPFVVAVIAPTDKDRVPGRPGRTYGASSRLWRPFADAQELPIAEYVSNVAERIGLPTRIVDFGSERGVFDSCPGVLLIDPWILAAAGGEAVLSSARQRLRQWATPLIVVDRSDPRDARRAAQLADAAADMLTSPGDPRVRQVGGLNEFMQMMPSLVTRVRRRYLRNAPVFPPKGPHTPRPRLTGHNATARQIKDIDE